MASLSVKGGVFYLHFRYGGRQQKRSLGTTDEQQANQARAIVEKTVRLLKDGDYSFPSENPTADQVWQFLRSGGKVFKQAQIMDSVSLGKLIQEYLDSIPRSGKAKTTICTENIHCNHLLRRIGKSKNIECINTVVIENYIKTRQKDKGRRGKPLAACTINKEIGRLRKLLEIGKERGYVHFDKNPVDTVIKPKPIPKEKFRTYDQISERVERGNLTKAQLGDLWECLFLRPTEIAELLEHVKEYSNRTGNHFVYAMFCFAAYTGCRRSEMMRAQVYDYGNLISLREKKKRRDLEWSFREVKANERLKPIMADWLTHHPGGDWLFCREADVPITKDQAHYYFTRATRNSKWEVMAGYHCLRHSFASIMALAGESHEEIKRIMGHATDQMHERYTHLFPERTFQKIDSAFDVDVAA